MDVWYNPLVRWVLRSPLHWMVSPRLLLLTYTGRKSGTTYSVPLEYAQNNGRVMLVTDRRKAWWKNLRGGAPVTLRLKGREMSGQAEPIEMNEPALRAFWPTLSPATIQRLMPNLQIVHVTLQPEK